MQVQVLLSALKYGKGHKQALFIFRETILGQKIRQAKSTQHIPRLYDICGMLRKEILMLKELLEILPNFLLVILGVVIIPILMGSVRFPEKNKYSGTMICGKNRETGQPVYRVEFDIPLEDIPKKKKLVLRVMNTDENLGINQRLYDLESEGIRHDD